MPRTAAQFALFDTIARQTIAYTPRKVNVFEMAKLLIARCPAERAFCQTADLAVSNRAQQSAESCIIVGPLNADHFAATLLGVQKVGHASDGYHARARATDNYFRHVDYLY